MGKSKIHGFDHSFPSCFKISYLKENCNTFKQLLLIKLARNIVKHLLKQATAYTLLRASTLMQNRHLAAGVEPVSSESMGE